MREINGDITINMGNKEDELVEFQKINLFEDDELNELVNFYFEIYRNNHKCPHCDGDALNPATKQISLASSYANFFTSTPVSITTAASISSTTGVGSQHLVINITQKHFLKN
mgnify:CR=1 FL=1